MIFSYSIDTPASTPFDTPLKTVVDIARGVIHRWVIFLPPGSMDTLSVKIQKGSEFVLPSNPTGFIQGNNFTLSGDDFIYIKNDPFKLDIYSWNTDSRNDHRVFVHVFMKPLWSFSPYSGDMMTLVEESELMRVL